MRAADLAGDGLGLLAADSDRAFARRLLGLDRLAPPVTGADRHPSDGVPWTSPFSADGGKKIPGRKRHIVVDTPGLLPAVPVTAAGADDGAAAPQVIGRPDPVVQPRLETVRADGKHHDMKLYLRVAGQRRLPAGGMRGDRPTARGSRGVRAAAPMSGGGADAGLAGPLPAARPRPRTKALRQRGAGPTGHDGSHAQPTGPRRPLSAVPLPTCGMTSFSNGLSGRCSPCSIIVGGHEFPDSLDS